MNAADPTHSSSRPSPVAIIGMGCLFPGAGDLARYWANIRDRRDAIAEVPATHWRPEDYYDPDPKAPDRTYARRGGFLAPVDFPALDFGIAPKNLDATDTTQLLGLLAARAALEDAGYTSGPGRPGRAFDRGRVSVLLGVTGTLELVIPLGARLGHPIWRRALKASGVADDTAEEVVRRISDSYVGWQENSFPGLLGNVAAGRIANRLDLGGTNCVIDAACASSLGALNLALHELASGGCDMALSGGLDTFNDIFMYMCFSKTPALSPTGDARPFDAAGDGTILGEGLGVLVLKRLADARRDGDRIYAVIRGVGSSSDGHGGAVYAPSASGQAKALRRAYERAGFSPATVELVEAHGTGTKVGDATEVAALAEVFRAARPEGAWCALGSVKSQIGHTKAAAGAAGLIKAALALHHKVLPPTIKVSQPIEAAAPGRSPFYLNTEPRPWLPRAEHPRRAAVSAFGFGGSNFHCVLEEAEAEPSAVDWDGDVQILAFSADRPEALRAALDAWPGDLEWDALRAEAARSRARFQPDDPCRLLLVVERATTDLARVFASARAHIAADRGAGTANEAEGIFFGQGPRPGGLAILFPGQGSQYVGMLRDLACRFPAFHAALATADATPLDDGRRLGDLIYPHPAFTDDERARHEADLRATEVAQPSLGAVSLGALAVLDHFGVRPEATAGHSYGELTALCAAGRIDAAALDRLSRRRGRLMADAGQGTGNAGAMLAVMAPLATIEEVVRGDGLDVVIANKNAPEQAVISGPAAEVARARDRFTARGVTTHPLAVSAAFHSRFVAAAREPFAAALEAETFAPSRVPVYANTTGESYPDEPGPTRALLADQLARPVEFVAEIESLHRSGARTFLEVGPDRKLTGLVGAILKGRPHDALALDASRGRRGNLVDLARALAQLAALGHPVQLARWDEGADRLVRPSNGKKGLTVKVSGANATPAPASAPPPTKTIAKTTTPSPSNRDTPSTMTPPPSPRFPQAHTATANGDVHGHNHGHGNGTGHSHGSNGDGHGDHSAKARTSRNGMVSEPLPLPSLTASATSPGPLPALRSNDPALLAEALRTAQENLLALQKLGEQTAHLHRQFLDGQDRTRRTFQTLLEQQQKLVLASIGLEPLGPAPDLSAVTRTAPPTPPRVLPGEETSPPPSPPGDVDEPMSENRRGVWGNTNEASMPRSGATGSASAMGTWPEPAPPRTPPADVDRGGFGARAQSQSGSTLAESVALEPFLPEPQEIGALIGDGSVEEGRDGTPAAQARIAAVQEILLAIVAEKTGYPAEMLEPSMRLDADLGIDSIKRVEILSALQEQLPDAPVIKPEHLGTLQTLGQIVEFLAVDTNTPAPGMAVASPHPSPPSQGGRECDGARADQGQIAAVQETLLAIVAEKTGYPAEMLEPAMRLDADLGIDSIKRVEILSALQEQLPDAPVIKPEHLGTLQTLGQIVEFLAVDTDATASGVVPQEGCVLPSPLTKGGLRGVPGAGPERPGQGFTPPTPPSQGGERIGKSRYNQSGIPTASESAHESPSLVQEILLAIVAEKTGYPAEMLEPAMRLDADLGIDSIKRVEILSALQEQLPDAPVIKPEHLGTLQTLGQIVEFLSADKSEVVQHTTTTVGEGGPVPVSIQDDPVPLQRLVLTRSPLDPSRPREPVGLRPGGLVWIGDLGDDDGLAGALADALRARGYQARRVARAEIGREPTPARLDGLIVLAPASGGDDGALRDAFRLVRHAGPGLRQTGRERAGSALLATVARLDGGFGTRGLDPRTDPAAGGLAGIAKTAGHEWPEVACKAIDLDPTWARTDVLRVAETVVDELLHRGPAEVGLTRDGRSTLTLVPTALHGDQPGASDRPPLDPGDVVVISGGARGITAEVAVALAEAFRPTLVLLGRSPAPDPEPDWLAALGDADEPAIKRELAARANGRATPQSIGEQYRRVAAGREIARTLARIEAAGARAVYRAIDVRDEHAVAACLDAIRDEFGPVRGLVHGAGVLADRRIEDQSDEQFAEVHDTKVIGLRALLDAIGTDSHADAFRVLVLFSSSTARFGRTGQVAYAAANEVLNKWAWREAACRPGCRVVSVNWGPWDGGMVNASLKPLFAAEGIGLIPPRAGARYLVDEIRQQGHDRPVEVVILGGSTLPEGLTGRHEAPAADVPAAPPSPSSPAPSLSPVFEQSVDVASIPVLRSHVIDGRPVLPMALILEWMAQGALQRNPGLAFLGAEDVRLLKGVIVRDEAPEIVRVLAGKARREAGEYRVAVELRGMTGDGREFTHARGTIALGDRLAPAPAGASFAPPLLAPCALDPRSFYRDVLFHGPELHGLERIEGCDERGIVAVCATAPPPSAWLDRPPRQSWLTDPLVIDGVFQNLILWSATVKGAGSLPTYIGRYRQYRRAFPPDRVRIAARIIRASDRSARAEIVILDTSSHGADALIARMDDYECVIDPSLNRAFRHNQLAQTMPG